jgi:hypothetical protein
VYLARPHSISAFRILRDVFADHHILHRRNRLVKFVFEVRQTCGIGTCSGLFEHRSRATDSHHCRRAAHYFGVTRIFEPDQLQCAASARVAGNFGMRMDKIAVLFVHAE